MNNKIQDIAAKSSFPIVTGEDVFYLWQQDQVEAFADAIIKECADAFSRYNKLMSDNLDIIFKTHFNERK